MTALFALAASHGGASASESRAPFDPGRLSFRVRVRGEINPYSTLAVCAMPGEAVNIEVIDPAVARLVEASAGDSNLRAPGVGRWIWTAPTEARLYPVVLRRSDTGEAMTLNMLVLVPATEVKDGYLNGYRIGRYPRTAWKGLAIYLPPRGFIEVTEESLDTPVSPHFRLGQFLCKQEAGYPKYLVLRERLLLKLELILERANERGMPVDRFHVMSGYRTPYYNHEIGNVSYSRHLWGGAADIFVDEDPEDGQMDDLNGDGVYDVKDAGVLYDMIDDLYGKPFYERFLGGLGQYRRSANHGPFVHVDVRGFRARWGD
jgi:hypothetical protein